MGEAARFFFIGSDKAGVLLVTKEHLPLATEEIPANVAVNNQRFS